MEAVFWAFVGDVDYGPVVKSYEAEPIGPGRYSPPKVTSVERTAVFGKSNTTKVSTSHVERQNLAMRMFHPWTIGDLLDAALEAAWRSEILDHRPSTWKRGRAIDKEVGKYRLNDKKGDYILRSLSRAANLGNDMMGYGGKNRLPRRRP